MTATAAATATGATAAGTHELPPGLLFSHELEALKNKRAEHETLKCHVLDPQVLMQRLERIETALSARPAPAGVGGTPAQPAEQATGGFGPRAPDPWHDYFGNGAAQILGASFDPAEGQQQQQHQQQQEQQRRRR